MATEKLEQALKVLEAEKNLKRNEKVDYKVIDEAIDDIGKYDNFNDEDSIGYSVSEAKNLLGYDPTKNL
jgi:hypothetical protein|tara:strand:- start:2577 stop:2783 length:207 start_codon:yes stop_codon:yes gene_type:complete